MPVRDQAESGLPPVGVTAAMLAMMMAIATFPQFLFGSVAPFMLDEYGLTRSELGLLTTALFATAAVVSPLMGSIASWLPLRRGYAALFMVAVVAAVGLAFARNQIHLMVFAALPGLAVGLSNPVTNQLIPELVATRWRGLVLGIKQSGVQVGAMLTGISLPLLVAGLGWRPALLVVAAFMALVGFAFLPITPRASEEHAREPRRPSNPEGTRRVVIALAAFAFVMGSAMSAIISYLPLYGFEVLDISDRVAGGLLSMVAVTGISSRIVVGHLAYRRTDLVTALGQIATLGAVALLLVVTAPVTGVAMLWVGALVFGMNLSWNSIALVAVVKSDRINTATGSAHVMMGFYAGFILVPPVFGRIVDVTGSYLVPWTFLTVLMALTAAVTFHIGRTSPGVL